MNKFFYLILFCFVMINTKTNAQIQFGVFADCQFCNCETAGKRHYRNSLGKLDECISYFNGQNLDFVVGLGDLIDRDFSSFDQIKAVLDKSKQEVFHVIGNHDYSVESQYFDKIPEQLQLQNSYYSFSQNNWQFIFLNGNEITFQTNDPKIISEAELMVKKLANANQPNRVKWNGGISKTQVLWLKDELSKADKKNKKVILFCHYPIFPIGKHTLWNANEIIPVLKKHSCVKAWINGHNHAGDYHFQDNIHFLTLHGMVDTEHENAYAKIVLHANRIEVTGFGREQSRTLKIK